jgi:hypothetical protein
MKSSSFNFVMAMAAVLALVQPLPAHPQKPKQFIYVLRLVPRLYESKKWTKEDNAVSERFAVALRARIHKARPRISRIVEETVVSHRAGL